MAANPAWRDSIWQYERTTNEDIPLFSFVGDDEELQKLIDFEQYIDEYFPEQGTVYWVTPKGCPRSRKE